MERVIIGLLCVIADRRNNNNYLHSFSRQNELHFESEQPYIANTLVLGAILKIGRALGWQ